MYVDLFSDENNKSNQTEEANEQLVRSLVIDASVFQTNMKYAEALAYYQKALEIRPESASLRFLYAKCFMSFAFQTPYRIDFLVSTKKYFREAYLVDSSNIELMEMYGRLMVDPQLPSLYSPSEALPIFQRLSSITDDPSHLHSLAVCYEGIKEYKKAIDIFSQIYEKTENADYLMIITKLLYENDEMEAKRYVREIHSKEQSEQTLRELADLVLFKKDTLSYSEIVDKLYSIDPNNVDYLNAHFQACLDTRTYKKLLPIITMLGSKDATIDYERYIFALNGHLYRDSFHLNVDGIQDVLELEYRLFEKDVQINFYGAIISKKAKFTDLEAKFFQRLYTIADTSKDLANELVVQLFQEGKFVETIEKAKYYIAKYPSEWGFLFLKGLALQNTSKYEEAMEIFQSAIGLNENNVYLWINLGLCANRIGKLALSDSAYEKAIELDPSMPLALNNYAYSLVERKLELQKALKMSKSAIEKEPENASYLDTYGWILFHLGNPQEAIVYLERAIATQEASAIVYEHLGDAYTAVGEKSKAKEAYLKALQMDPNLASTKERLEK